MLSLKFMDDLSTAQAWLHNATDFARNQPNRSAGIETTRAIAGGIHKVADYLADTNQQRLVACLAVKGDPAVSPLG
jgi:hypothetical protein